MDDDISAGATHYLLSHLSIKGSEWVLRREFPISASFRPSGTPLHYTELDSDARKAIKEHLSHVNGGVEVDDMGSGRGWEVNWTLCGCWRLNDMDHWFSFVVVLQSMPVARALRRGLIAKVDPKPRVLYHLSTDKETRTVYTIEESFPISDIFDPSSTPSTSYNTPSNSSDPAAKGSVPPYANVHTPLDRNYDTIDPGGRRAIQQIIDRANRGERDLLKMAWSLHSISEMNTASYRRKSGQNIKTGLAIVLEWQPGIDVAALNGIRGLGLGVTGIERMDGMSIADTVTGTGMNPLNGLLAPVTTVTPAPASDSPVPSPMASSSTFVRGHATRLSTASMPVYRRSTVVQELPPSYSTTVERVSSMT